MTGVLRFMGGRNAAWPEGVYRFGGYPPALPYPPDQRFDSSTLRATAQGCRPAATDAHGNGVANSEAGCERRAQAGSVRKVFHERSKVVAGSSLIAILALQALCLVRPPDIPRPRH